MTRRTIGRALLSAILVFSLSVGCDSSGCDIIEEMPAGNEVPSSQTIEGGIQARITQNGFAKISAVLPGLVDSMIGQGLTVIPESGDSWGDCNLGCVIFTLCPGGCNMTVDLPDGSTDIHVDSPNNMIVVDMDLNISLPLVFNITVDSLLGNIMDYDCGVTLHTPDQPVSFQVGIRPYIRESDGEMRLELVEIDELTLFSSIDLAWECGIVGEFLDTYDDYVLDVLAFIDGILNNSIVQWLVNEFLLPQLQGLIDDLIPDPLGIEGQVDVGSLLASFSPGAAGKIELRVVPGGYVNLLSSGMSLGVITGVNSDYDPTTRLPTLDQYNVAQHSEPHPKMPPMPTIDLSQGQFGGLTPHPSRGNFVKAAASELGGTQDGQLTFQHPDTPANLQGQTADVAIGLTESFLDLFGFHLLNSGALCLEIGTSEVEQISVGFFSIIVSSFEDLIDPEVGDAPMRLVIRPQTPMDFTIGNTLANPPEPLLDLYLQDFQIDVYPFFEGRYVRAFTMGVDMHLGVDIEPFVDPNDGALYIHPVLHDPEDTTIRIDNSELISDLPEDLGPLMEGIMGMIMPMLTGALPDIPMPEFAGLSLEFFEARPNDSFNVALILASMATPSPPPHPLPVLPVKTRAEVLEVHVPTPEALRASLYDQSIPKAEKDVPQVRIAVTDRVDPNRRVEWTYRLNGGAWRPFRPGPELVIRDPAFYLQGWYRIEILGRVPGYLRTQEREPVAFDVLIDSVAPRQFARAENGTLYFGGFDLVTPASRLEYSYEFEPGRYSVWSRVDALPLARARSLAAAHGGVLRLRIRDEAGNVSEHAVDPEIVALHDLDLPHGSGCGCATGTGDGVPIGWLFGLLLLGLLLRRRGARWRPFSASLLGLLFAGALALGACSKTPGGTHPDGGAPPCSDDDDCAALQCEDGQIPLCINGVCQCMDDLVVGKVGPHSSCAVSYSDVMVAAYNQRWGDLMYGRIAKNDIGSNPIIDNWEFVDGVPWDEEPDIPTSEIRGGIADKGDNVGRFTSIAADSSGYPMIAYYDLTHGALKFARFDGTNWLTHVVDDGGDMEGPEGGDAGRYTAISTHPSNQAPGIAYLVQYLPGLDAEHLTAEIRFAEATRAQPSSGADWMVRTVDTVQVPIPQDDEGNPLDVDDWPLGDWPAGIGVTCSVDRTSDGRPVVAYYDSVNGNLKASEFDGSDFTDKLILDGEDGEGNDLGNVGLFPSIMVDPADDTIWHVSYVHVGLRNLWYLRTGNDGVIELVDDGLRQSTNELTGLPMPVSHFVGFDSKIVVAGVNVHIAFQDGTDHALLWAVRDVDNRWTTRVIKGDTPPTARPDGGFDYEGAFGFYVSLAVDANMAYISTYAVNVWDEGNELLGIPPLNYWVQIFAEQLGEG